MSDEDVEFGDFEPEDSVDDGDGQEDWSQVEVLQTQMNDIEAIEDDAERNAAAQAWAAELAGE